MIVCRKDINGQTIEIGDIVAEGIINTDIWGGLAVIVQRPLGVIIPKREPSVSTAINFDIVPIREGKALLAEKIPDFIKNDSNKNKYDNLNQYINDNMDTDGAIKYNICNADEQRFSWNVFEVIGNVYELKK